MSEAIQRATQAWAHESGLLPEEVDREHEYAIHAAVSAALHDSTDGDVIAAVLDAHDPEVRYWRDGSYKETYCYGCGTTLPAETFASKHQADALRDEILGKCPHCGVGSDPRCPICGGD